MKSFRLAYPVYWLFGFLILNLMVSTAVSATPTRLTTHHRVPWLCGEWFLSGANVPWQNGGYGTDFGTVEEWGNYHTYSAADTADMFAALRAGGVNTVRWWVFTDGRGAPEFDSASGGAVTGLDANFLPSLASAISLAQQYDIYLIFALWDFALLDDENIADGEHAGGHRDLIVEAAKRQSFINNALLPMLQHPIAGTPYTVGTHPNVLGWDVINEPEWGIIESGAVNADISQPVTLAQMQRFVAEIAAAIHQNSSQLVTVGSASIKWNSDTALGATGNWWADADLTPFAAGGYLDFYQPHYYGWMNGDEVTWSYSPLFNSTADAGFDKPAVIGELPANAAGLGLPLAGVLNGIYANGYAGFWTWSYEDDGSGGVFGTWPDSAAAVTAFNQAHKAETAINCGGGLPDATADRVLGQSNFTSSGSGTTAASLNGPAGVAVGPDGRLFVVDHSNSRVLSWPNAAAFSNGAAASLVLGQPNFTSATPGSTLNRLNQPESVAVDPGGNVFVADTYNHRVVVYSPPFSNGMNASLTFGQFNTNPDCQNPTPTTFCYPRGIATDTQGNLYLADEFHGRILIYDAPLSYDTLPDLTLGGLADPRGVAVDGAGNVYATDSENDRVLQYNSPRTTDTVADRIFGTGSDGFHCFEENAGAPVNATTLACPIDLALDGSGNLYVSDLYNHRVLVYLEPLTDNTPDAVFGQGGSFTGGNANHGGLSAASIHTPLGLALDNAGNLYLADFGNNRLLAYDAPPAGHAIYLPAVMR